MAAPGQSRAFWVVPAQPMQRLFGAQGGSSDIVAGTVLMVLIAGMSMNVKFNGLPPFHVSISQRELARRLGLTHKVIRNALKRLEGQAHITPLRGTPDGPRKGTNARTVYRVDLLADRATAFHSKGTSTGPSAGNGKGTSNKQIEVAERDQTPEQRSTARQRSGAIDQTRGLDSQLALLGGSTGSSAGRSNGVHPGREWSRPYYEAWVKRFGGHPNVGFLRKKLEPLERDDGRDITIRRWHHFVDGLDPRFFSTKGDPFRYALLRFAGAPAAYDDAQWHMSDRDRSEYARLTEGL